MTEQKIYYKRVRDLSGIFSATFGFIKQNFKTLYGSLLFFAGPFLLIAATLSAYLFGSNLGMNKLLRGGLTSFYGDLIGSYIISMGLVLIGLTIYNVILNRNLIENEKLQSGEPLTLAHSKTNFWPDFGRVLANSVLLILVLILFVVVIALVFGGIFALLGGDRGASGAIILTVIVVILLFFALLIFGPILMFVPMAALFVCQRDSLSLFPAMGKVLRYMKNNFWMTWVISFVGFLAYSVLGFIVQIPVFIISMITAFSRIKSTVGYGLQDDSTPLLLVIIMAVCSLLSYGVLVVYHLINIYQYTSLEEKKEGSSIIDKINQIQ
ncbi:MAG: hypothetical protein H0W61_03960 [Bacteroidetes bacterium]|nr:hypothetical protein [Bacteroidota bacterium]